MDISDLVRELLWLDQEERFRQAALFPQLIERLRGKEVSIKKVILCENPETPQWLFDEFRI